jgi:DNA-binding protein HU-beta
MKNRTDVISTIASKTKMTKIAVSQMLHAFEETVTETLRSNEGIQLVGFLTITKIQRKPKKGRNPATGASIDIPAKKAVKVKVGATLKNSIK